MENKHIGPDICFLWIKVNGWNVKILGILRPLMVAWVEFSQCWHKGQCDSLEYLEKAVTVTAE